jgi:isopentenyldiphosphate isomerase
MEHWDILDAEGNKTGKTIERGRTLKSGEYHLVVHIYIINSIKEFLIQKRSMKKDIWPGRWDVTGGAVICGEDSITGAVREVEEELGVTIAPEKFKLITRLKRRDFLIDVWAAFKDIQLDKVVMQEDEVDEVKYVNPEDMVDILFGHEKADLSYRELMQEFIERL